MKDFRFFDTTDFVLDEDFVRWVYNNAEKDQLFWNNWLRQNPDKHLVVSEARRILESIRMKETTVAEVDIQDETERLLQTIHRESQPVALPARHRIGYKRWWYAAALLVLLAGSARYFFNTGQNEPARFTYKALTLNKHFIEHANTSGKTATITLDDGSTVELAAGARISYANDFDTASSRDVYLSGQAFFKVTKNPRRPFRVFANEIVTKVLGTSFLIRAYESDTTIRVTVRTGKVSVYSQATGNTREMTMPAELGGYILTPNQQLVYEKSGQKFQKVLLEQPEMILPVKKEKRRVYEDTPLEEVFTQLIKDYGVNIVYDNELVKKCTVTADLTDETFYRKLDFICRAVGARYQVMDGQVVIQANGCE